MNIDSAKAGGDLAARIQVRTDRVASINQMIADGWQVTDIRAMSPDGIDTSLIIEKLDIPTSKMALGYALQIYQAQLDALNQQLSALT